MAVCCLDQRNKNHFHPCLLVKSIKEWKWILVGTHKFGNENTRIPFLWEIKMKMKKREINWYF